MQLMSVNISGVKTVEHRGEMVVTGIFKQPINAPVHIGFNGVEGDTQANLEHHGGVHKAVYGFSQGHYDYWQTLLQKTDLRSGAFGENLTIANLDESTIFLGDQFQIGTCILEVSQPRIPCFKLGIALSNSQAPGLFTKSFKTGVYYRVIREGVIEAGQSVERVAQVKQSISIETLFRAYFDRAFIDADETFAKALLIQALAPEWRQKINERMN